MQFKIYNFTTGQTMFIIMSKKNWQMNHQVYRGQFECPGENTGKIEEEVTEIDKTGEKNVTTGSDKIKVY